MILLFVLYRYSHHYGKSFSQKCQRLYGIQNRLKMVKCIVFILMMNCPQIQSGNVLMSLIVLLKQMKMAFSGGNTIGQFFETDVGFSGEKGADKTQRPIFFQIFPKYTPPFCQPENARGQSAGTNQEACAMKQDPGKTRIASLTGLDCQLFN